MNFGQFGHVLNESPNQTFRIEVDVEVQGATIEIYRVASAEKRDGQLVFKMAAKQTACLAPDKCGLDVVTKDDKSCCGSQSNCC